MMILHGRLGGKNRITFECSIVHIPIIIADNAGLDRAELIPKLCVDDDRETSTAVIDVIAGNERDMEKLGLSESFNVKQAVLLSTIHAAEMMLRVDEIIACAAQRRKRRKESNLVSYNIIM